MDVTKTGSGFRVVIRRPNVDKSTGKKRKSRIVKFVVPSTSLTSYFGKKTIDDNVAEKVIREAVEKWSVSFFREGEEEKQVDHHGGGVLFARKSFMKFLKQKNQHPQQQQQCSSSSSDVDRQTPPSISSVLPHSIFAPEKNGSANTKAFVAPSFSGKTTFMVMELNRLTEEELNEYSLILLFTHSPHAKPYEFLQKRVASKILKFNHFVPSIIQMLSAINKEADNNFKFLVLMDDCLNLRGDLIMNMILTMRNANISTVLCIQYSKLLLPSQRQSIHDFFFMNLKAEDFEYMLSGFIGPHIREILVKEGCAEAAHENYHKLSILARARFKDSILHFNQREDFIAEYKKEKFDIGNNNNNNNNPAVSKEGDTKHQIDTNKGTVNNRPQRLK